VCVWGGGGAGAGRGAAVYVGGENPMGPGRTHVQLTAVDMHVRQWLLWDSWPALRSS
jgi:hypothetical protein